MTRSARIGRGARGRPHAASPLGALANLPLVQATAGAGAKTLVYQGSWNVPQGEYPSGSGDLGIFSFMNSGMSFNPYGNGGLGSLFMTGHASYGRVAEITLATPTIAARADALPTATVLQNFVDPTNGQQQEIWYSPPGNPIWPSGVHVFNNGTELLVSYYDSYDTIGAALFCWRLSSNLSTAAATTVGACNLHDPNISESTLTGRAGWLGHFADIPTQWQATFGGFKALTGHFGMSIVSRTSSGPTATAFNPEDIGVTPALGKRLFGYPIDHPTLGAWNQAESNLLYNSASIDGGMVFVKDTRSVLVFGKSGAGDYCYGTGVSNPALHHTYEDEFHEFCYDLSGLGSVGQHDYPYHFQIWAYDALDMKDVFDGVKEFWEIVPYAYWPFAVPFITDDPFCSLVTGVAYDAAHQLIFLTVRNTPTDATSASTEATYGMDLPLVGGFGSHPIIHVYHIE